MIFLKQTLILVLILGRFSLASTFEQNGVKEGNSKISVTFLSSIDDDDEIATTFQAQYGYFFTDTLECFIKVEGYTREMMSDLEIYTTGIGGNFYFLKTPILTPYFGGNIYHYNFAIDVSNRNTGKKQRAENNLNGGELHIGTHYFLNENTAITPEIGIHYLDFEKYSQSYFNLLLSYMF